MAVVGSDASATAGADTQASADTHTSGAPAGAGKDGVAAAAAAGREAPRFTCDYEELPDGEFIWNASRALLFYLEEPKRAEMLRGKRILELGSGLGHLGYGMARLGASVTCTERGKCLEILRDSLAGLEREHGAVASAGGELRVIELSWGEEGFGASALGVEANAEDFVPFDFIISAELVFLEETHDLLIWTLDRLCAPQTVIYSVFINRPFSWNFFAKLHDIDVFEVEQIEEADGFDSCNLEECHMHRLTRKRG